MGKIVIIGGGWAGCAAAIRARKQGHEVQLLEKTDLLLGLGNVGGIMRNNGRYTAAEENIALGADELFEITDRLSTHRNIDFPGHRHASFYDVALVEPEVRRLLTKLGVELHMMTRVVDVELANTAAGAPSACVETAGAERKTRTQRETKSASADQQDAELAAAAVPQEAKATLAVECSSASAAAQGMEPAGAARQESSSPRRLRAVVALTHAHGGEYRREIFDGDVFVETTGSTGPMGNCTKYGNGCAMCILRCPAFGPRVSLTERAGLCDISGERSNGMPGAFSGSCKLEKRTLSPKLQKRLKQDGFAVIPLPPELVHREKLDQKVCQQYALDPFAENIILIDTGHAKLMTSYFNLEELRRVDGLENARFVDPYAGGKGNSMRYMAVGLRDDTMCARGIENLFLGGEKSGFFVGHTEAITTGSLAGYNAGRMAAGTDAEQPLLRLPRTLAVGDIIAFANEMLETPEGFQKRLTFAGGLYFQRMQEQKLYSTERRLIQKRVSAAGLADVYKTNKM